MAKGLLIRITIGLIASGLIAAAIKVFVISSGGTISVNWGDRPVDFLSPAWFYLAALVPYFFVVRTQSLTDVSLTQQYLATCFRSVLVLGIAVAMARPVWTSSDNKVATVVLVDVSESVSDKQLDEAVAYVADIAKAKSEDDKLYVVTFAERPRLVREEKGETIERHAKRSAATNIQVAMQFAYGLFPDGYLPRVVIISDGNETGGDLLVESYRAEELGVRVSWQVFATDRVKEIRIASLRLPDEIKVGAPFEVKAEIWSTHEEEITLRLQQDDFPNGLEPSKRVKLHAGMNLVKFKSQAKRAGHTTFRLRIAKVVGDTEKKNNISVMTAPVKGRPRVLYVEGGLLRQPSSAGYMKRALEHENIDVEVRGPRGLPSSANDLKKYDLVLISDVPVHFMGMPQMSALERYVRDFGGGLIIAGGEDSFGSGGYQNTKIEKIMPVRFDSEKMIDQPKLAIVLVIDRSGSMSGPKLAAAKESARATAEVLAASDQIAVVAFDNQPKTIVRLQRASNRLRISTDIGRLTAGGGTNIRPALQEAHQILQGTNAKVKHVIVLSDGQAPYDGIAELCQEMRSSRITVSAVGIGDADRNLLNIIADNGDGRLYMTDDLAALPRTFMK